MVWFPAVLYQSVCIHLHSIYSVVSSLDQLLDATSAKYRESSFTSPLSLCHRFNVNDVHHTEIWTSHAERENIMCFYSAPSDTRFSSFQNMRLAVGWWWWWWWWGPFSILHILSFSIEWEVIALHFPNVLQNRHLLGKIFISWNVQFEFISNAIHAFANSPPHDWGCLNLHQFT